jgi:hypothetical protein
MALGTAHIHLLDTEQFSDYSPPIELSGLVRATAAEEVIERADSQTKEICWRGKTESARQKEDSRKLCHMNRLGVHRSVRILVAATQENGVGGDLRRVWDALRLRRLNQFLRGLNNEACFTVWSPGPGLLKASWGTALRGEIVSAPGCAGKGIAIGFSAQRESPTVADTSVLIV